MELFYFSKSKEDEERLADFIKSNSNKSGTEFLQSIEWGNFLELSGEEIIRLGVREKLVVESIGNKRSGRILLVATLVKKKIFGNFFYWYLPRGPIYNSNAKVLEFFFDKLKRIYPDALFLRFEPSNQTETESKYIIKKTINLQPAKTLILDLIKNEAMLLTAMHQKTRYNIRLAEKKGVSVKEGSLDNSDDIKEFWRLLKTTGERDNFRLHSFTHYEKLLGVNKIAPGFIKLFLAQFEGKNIAAGIFSYYGDKVTYLHGASDNEFRNLMAPYLLQFEIIKKARAANYLYYDFYGIDEKKWPGVTRFKLGFGGQVFNYAGTYDLIFNQLLYRIYKFLRKIKRAIK